jgi:hypothetical protein
MASSLREAIEAANTNAIVDGSVAGTVIDAPFNSRVFDFSVSERHLRLGDSRQRRRNRRRPTQERRPMPAIRYEPQTRESVPSHHGARP